MTDDSYPIRLAAERAGELEDRAKGEPGKDAIALFDPFLEHTYHWEEFSENVLGTKCALLTRFLLFRRCRAREFLPLPDR